MAPKRSSRAVRIRGLGLGTSSRGFEETARRLEASAQSSRRTLFSSTPDPRPGRLDCSLALQNEFKTGTIIFCSAELKAKVMKLAAETRIEWTLDDQFDGLTVLHATDEIDMDVCAVHGLGGNAFDTWLASTKMWLKDFLPNSSGFEKARIMTFGYNSMLVEKSSDNRLRDWADELLRQGGLVVREAMIRLDTQPEKFNGIKLENCGLMFLSTPHSGTTQADWNELLLCLCEAVLGVRSHAIIDPLRPFNPSSVDSEEAFSAMRIVPPLRCFCEGEKTVVGGKSRVIVNQSSAGFHGRVAEKILNVDHHSICKFESKFGGYMPVLDRLKKIRIELLSPYEAQSAHNMGNHIPGRASLVAPHYPSKSNTKWYAGSELRETSQLIGRVDTLNQIMGSLHSGNSGPPRLVALTGIGGIGKTEILLEVALRFRNIANVFLIRADDPNSLEDALFSIALGIGHDILSARHPQANLAAIWRGLGKTERVAAFKTWLGDSSNQPTLLLIDDLDRLHDEEAIRAALPREAQIILCSTRDPNISIGSLGRSPRNFHIPSMKVPEIVAVMQMVLDRHETRYPDAVIPAISKVELEGIAKAVGGHALAACRAISYIVNVLAQTTEDAPAKHFLGIFSGPDWQARQRFLSYKPKMGQSIMGNYAVSLERLPQGHVSTLKLLELIAFLSSSDHSLNYKLFLNQQRCWLPELRDELPDFEVFANGLVGQSEYLAELENVSLGTRSTFTGPLQIHTLWLECILQRAQHEGRVRWLRQIFLLCYTSWERVEDHAYDMLRPFVRNAITIAEHFQVHVNELLKSRDQLGWLLTFEEVESPGAASIEADSPGWKGPESESPKTLHTDAEITEAESLRSESPEPKSPVAKSPATEVKVLTNQDMKPLADNLGNISISEQKRDIHQPLSDLLLSCRQAAQEIQKQDSKQSSEEVFSAHLSVYFTLLRRLKVLEEDDSYDLKADRETMGLHAKVYESLILLAPFFQRRNPMLESRLRSRKEAVCSNAVAT